MGGGRGRAAASFRFDATSCMSGSDIAYVIRSQMRPPKRWTRTRMIIIATSGIKGG